MTRPTIVAEPLPEYIVVSEEMTPMKTFTELLNTPEMHESLATCTPTGRAFLERLAATLDSLPLDLQNIAVKDLHAIADARSYQLGRQHGREEAARDIVERASRAVNPPTLDAEDIAAIATVRAHFDYLARTAAERDYLSGIIDRAETSGDCPVLLNDLADALEHEPYYCGFLVTEAALGEHGGANKTGTPRVTMDGGALFVRCGDGRDPDDLRGTIEDRAHERPQFVREVVRLHTRGLVILDTDEETYVMTEAEYTAPPSFAPAVRLDPTYRAANGDLTSEPVGPVAYHDFSVGDGLTRVLIGPFEDERGIDLIIAGCQVGSGCVDDPQLTFQQVREIRDNLTTLLDDPRVVAALADR